MARHYYLGRWVWRSDELGAGWAWPAGAISAIDLRSLAAQAQQETVEGWGFFACETAGEVPGDAVLVGEGLNETAQRTDWQAAEQALAVTLDGTTPLDFLWEYLTVAADPEGIDGCPPLMPTSQAELELILQHHSIVRREGYDPARHPRVVDMLQRSYRVMREHGQAGRTDPEHHRRWLDFQREKYAASGLTWQEMIPADLPQEPPVPHRTTVSDDFNRADENPMTGWTTITGSVGVVSNRASARNTVVRNYARFNSVLDGEDIEANVTGFINSGATNVNAVGVRFDFDTGTQTNYHASAVTNAPPARRLTKNVGGTLTDLDSVSTAIDTPGAGFPLHVKADGSSISGTVQGSTLSATDTSITGADFITAGLVSYVDAAAGDVEWDDWSAADLSSAPAVTGTVLLSGGGTLAAQGAKAASGTVSIAGGGAIAATGSKAASGTASISGGGTIATSGAKGALATATISGGGALVITGVADRSDTVTIAGGGVLAVTGARGAIASATISGGGAVAATGTKHASGIASISGGGIITASGTSADGVAGTASISGGGTVTASGIKGGVGSAEMAGGGSLAAIGTKHASGTTILAGGGTITVTPADVGAPFAALATIMIEPLIAASITVEPSLDASISAN